MDNCVDIKLGLSLSNGKADLAAELLSMLLAELAQNQREINHALATSQFGQALELIHKLHGACCYCGVPLLKAACKKLESQLHTQLQLPASDDIHAFNEAVQTLLLWHAEHDVDLLFALDK